MLEPRFVKSVRQKRIRLNSALIRLRAAPDPALEIRSYLGGHRRRLAGGFVDQHIDRLRRRDAFAFAEYHLLEGDRGAAELHDAEPEFRCHQSSPCAARLQSSCAL